MNIDQSTLSILEQCTVKDAILFLPSIQLERNEYQKVNKVLECLGGKWNRKSKGHTFDGDPSDALESALQSGVVSDWKKETDYFPTPPEIARLLIKYAEIQPGNLILEPSSGRGAIAAMIRDTHPDARIVCCEKNPDHAQVTSGLGLDTICDDFLTHEWSEPFDRVIANPPFSRQQDIDHVDTMIDCCVPGGRVVSVMASGVMFRSNKKTVTFRNRVLECGGYFEPLPEGSFKSSGTMVNTIVVVVPKGMQ